MPNRVKFLVDESSGIKLVRWLQEAGFDTLSVIEVMPGAKDKQVLERAFSENRVLVTNDKDFGRLIERCKFSHRGIILLRLKNDTPSTRILVVQSLISKFGEQLQDKFIVAGEQRVRIRTRK